MKDAIDELSSIVDKFSDIQEKIGTALLQYDEVFLESAEIFKNM